jgi:hypothetical protein
MLNLLSHPNRTRNITSSRDVRIVSPACDPNRTKTVVMYVHTYYLSVKCTWQRIHYRDNPHGRSAEYVAIECVYCTRRCEVVRNRPQRDPRRADSHDNSPCVGTCVTKWKACKHDRFLRDSTSRSATRTSVCLLLS